MKTENFFTKNKSIVAFLNVEILGLVSFMFADISDVLNFFGALLSIVGFIFAFMVNKNKKDFIKLGGPIVILFIVSGIAAFGGLSHSFTKFSNVATFLAIPGFFGLGFFLRKLGEAKTKHVILAIGFGFAAVVFISTIATWLQYGFFYSLIFKIKGTVNYYYNGAPYNVTEEMNWLIGFKFSEVSLEYGGLFAILCGSFLPALLFVSPKEKKNEFIAIAVIGGVGLLSLITIPNFKAIIVLVVVSMFAFVYKYLKEHRKVVKGFKCGFFAIVGIALLFFVLSLINAAAGFVFKGFLDRIFVSNRFMSQSADVMGAVFTKTDSGYINLFGINLTSSAYNAMYGFEEIVRENTGIFEVQALKEVGIFGVIILAVFLVGMIYYVIKYIKSENDEPEFKNIIVTVLLSFFIYSSIFNDILPQTHEASNYVAFLRSAPFMVMLFLFGYIYLVDSKKEETDHE